MFLVNHPHKGSLHAPDFGLVAPTFHGDQRIGWIACAAISLMSAAWRRRLLSRSDRRVAGRHADPAAAHRRKRRSSGEDILAMIAHVAPLDQYEPRLPRHDGG